MMSASQNDSFARRAGLFTRPAPNPAKWAHARDQHCRLEFRFVVEARVDFGAIRASPVMWFCITKRLSRPFLYLVVIGILVIGIAWLDNNWSIRPPSRADFLGRMDNAIRASRDWVLATGDPTMSLINDESAALLQNAVLMHMVADCARASSDERLQQLAALYFL